MSAESSSVVCKPARTLNSLDYLYFFTYILSFGIQYRFSSLVMPTFFEIGVSITLKKNVKLILIYSLSYTPFILA